MKKIFLIFLLCASPLYTFANDFTSILLDWIKFEYVTYTIWSEHYNIKVAISDNAVELDELAVNHNGLTAINWVFFCPEDYSKCNGQNHTINERFQNGIDLSFYQDTGDRGVFWWDNSGVPFLFKTGYINPDKRWDIHEWLWNFPVLLSAWNDNISYYDAIGLLDIKMTVPAPRHFICSNKEKTKVLFGRSSSTSLKILTQRLPSIGCYDALNLDAGLSSHYIYNWADIINGKRNIIDWIVIEHTGIDVYDIRGRLDAIFTKYFEPYKAYTPLKSIPKIDSYIRALSEAKNTIYDKNSVETYSSLWEENWYRISIESVEDIKKIYIINVFLKKLKKLRWEIIAVTQNS